MDQFAKRAAMSFHLFGWKFWLTNAVSLMLGIDQTVVAWLVTTWLCSVYFPAISAYFPYKNPAVWLTLQAGEHFGSDPDNTSILVEVNEITQHASSQVWTLHDQGWLVHHCRVKCQEYTMFSCMRKMSSGELSSVYKGVFLLENVNYHIKRDQWLT